MHEKSNIKTKSYKCNSSNLCKLAILCTYKNDILRYWNSSLCEHLAGIERKRECLNIWLCPCHPWEEDAVSKEGFETAYFWQATVGALVQCIHGCKSKLASHLVIKVSTSWSFYKVDTVREKYLENEIFSRSGKSQGILWTVREIQKRLGKSGKSQGIWK